MREFALVPLLCPAMQLEPTQTQLRRAVFLDRDGVLIEDVNLLTRREQVRVLPGVSEALERLRQAGFVLIVVSNQTVVARGLASEEEVRSINQYLSGLLSTAAGPLVKAWYFCPHHPSATLPPYRVACECRKPRPGLLELGAREQAIDLRASFAVGDRVTDVIAGARAGCKTVLVQTGRHTDAPIESVEPVDTRVEADYTCADLAAAAAWIVKNR